VANFFGVFQHDKFIQRRSVDTQFGAGGFRVGDQARLEAEVERLAPGARSSAT
jgi:hypothetical protein